MKKSIYLTKDESKVLKLLFNKQSLNFMEDMEKNSIEWKLISRHSPKNSIKELVLDAEQRRVLKRFLSNTKNLTNMENIVLNEVKDIFLNNIQTEEICLEY
jgi:hypothetical protein